MIQKKFLSLVWEQYLRIRPHRLLILQPCHSALIILKLKWGWGGHYFISPSDTVAEEVIMWDDVCIRPPSDWVCFLAVRDIFFQLFYRCSGCFWCGYCALGTFHIRHSECLVFVDEWLKRAQHYFQPQFFPHLHFRTLQVLTSPSPSCFFFMIIHL